MRSFSDNRGSLIDIDTEDVIMLFPDALKSRWIGRQQIVDEAYAICGGSMSSKNEALQLTDGKTLERCIQATDSLGSWLFLEVFVKCQPDDRFWLLTAWSILMIELVVGRKTIVDFT